MVRFTVSIVGMLMLAGCASMHPAGGDVPGPDRALLAPEIVAARVTDTYQAVLRLRPDFLRVVTTRDGRNPAASGVRVYLDDAEIGGPEALHRVPLDDVTQIRYVPRHEADIRWAGRHPAGVILVSTEPDPR